MDCYEIWFTKLSWTLSNLLISQQVKNLLTMNFLIAVIGEEWGKTNFFVELHNQASHILF